MGKDVIISALACGGKMSCRKQAAEFEDPPVVININSGTGVSTGGGTVQGFRKAASQYRKMGDGSVLRGVFGTQKNLHPRRVCLVSYLDGWSFIHEVLKHDMQGLINTVIVLDGLNTRSIDVWESYAMHGNLWLAYTQKPHKTASSKSAAKRLQADYTDRLELPEYISNVQLDKSISIYSKAETPKTRIFHKDPLVSSSYLATTPAKNELMCLEYEGKKLQDQTYIQQYVQPRLWRLLREKWK